MPGSGFDTYAIRFIEFIPYHLKLKVKLVRGEDIWNGDSCMNAKHDNEKNNHIWNGRTYEAQCI
jgi:hypothetical protein